MDDILAALDGFESEARELSERVTEREREGGEPLKVFMAELDELFPELEELCKRRWLLEVLLRYCRMRESL